MMTDETKPGDFANEREGKYAHIKGWGIDASTKNDPTYPIKKRNNAEHEGYSWERPAQQAESVEILKSVERPNLTAVYGTSSPPNGLSGKIRRYAYKYSESSYGRWLPLILADRVDMVEGVIDDIKQGHFPNVIGEIGLMSEWKHNRKTLLKNALIGALAAGAIMALASALREDKK